MGFYTTIDHTADLGIHVRGANLKELFMHSGLAMFDMITDTQKLQMDCQSSFRINGNDWPDLMVNWLRELLYLWSGKEKLVKDIDIEIIEPFFISAQIHCTRFDRFRHNIRHDIKAVTYHQIAVEQTTKGWEATIIFDV